MSNFRFASVFVLLICCGCGDGRPVLVSVTGRLVVAGQPVVGGSLTLHPVEGVQAKGDRPSCQLTGDGSFQVQTYPYGNGAPPGQYLVTLDPALASRLKRPQLADPARTPLRLDVPTTGLTGHTLEIP